MKALINKMSVALLILLSAAFVANTFIRVSTPERSWGIIENVLWGKPFLELFVPQPSDNLKRWKAAVESSEKVVNIIQKYGVNNLLAKPELAKQLEIAQQESENAYMNSNAIPRNYLAESNQELPQAFFSDFVDAMDYWRRGFAGKNKALLDEGRTHYNSYIIWINSKDRNELKN